MTRLELNMKYDDFLIVKGLMLIARWKITIISLSLVQNDTNASKIRVLSSVAFSAIMKHLNNFWIYSMSVTLNKQEHWFKEYCLSRCYDPSWTKYEVWWFPHCQRPHVDCKMKNNNYIIVLLLCFTMTTPYHFTTSKIVLGSYKKGIGYSKLSMCYVFFGNTLFVIC
jgi:hypothetical protein